MAKDIVLFIPGIFGSRLIATNGNEIWPPSIREALTGYRKTQQLLSDDLVVDGIIKTICIDVYGKVLRALEGFGYSHDGSEHLLVPYAYDWRRDLISLAAQLDECLGKLVEEHGADAKIQLICHSMGGLLARACLERPEAASAPWRSSVKLAVFLATPHDGASMAVARAVGVGGSSIGVSEDDLRIIAGDDRYPTGFQLFPPAKLKTIWSLKSQQPFEPFTIFDSNVPAHASLSTKNLAAATRLHDALDFARRPPACRYFAVASAAHETVTRFDQDLDYLSIVKVKASGDGTVPITSAAALPIQTAFVEANHIGVAQKETTHRILGMLLGHLKPEPVIAASGQVTSPSLSLGETLIEQDESVEIVINLPGTDQVDAKVQITRQTSQVPDVVTLQVEAKAPSLTRVCLRSPNMKIGHHEFKLIVSDEVVDEAELLVTARDQTAGE